MGNRGCWLGGGSWEVRVGVDGCWPPHVCETENTLTAWFLEPACRMHTIRRTLSSLHLVSFISMTHEYVYHHARIVIMLQASAVPPCYVLVLSTLNNERATSYAYH